MSARNGAGGLVHVIDDDDAVRDALTLLLTASGHEVRAYASAPEFLDGLDARAGGCVITDVQMPQMTGLELLAQMRPRIGDFCVIVLTGQADVGMAVQALKNGASDFIEKPFDSQILLDAVRAGLARASQAQAKRGQLAETAQRLAGLTGRERDVLAGVVAGASNKEVARTLGISPRTVETYRASIMLKTQAASLSELVRLTLEAGD